MNTRIIPTTYTTNQNITTIHTKVIETHDSKGNNDNMRPSKRSFNGHLVQQATAEKELPFNLTDTSQPPRKILKIEEKPSVTPSPKKSDAQAFSNYYDKLDNCDKNNVSKILQSCNSTAPSVVAAIKKEHNIDMLEIGTKLKVLDSSGKHHNYNYGIYVGDGRIAHFSLPPSSDYSIAPFTQASTSESSSSQHFTVILQNMHEFVEEMLTENSKKGRISTENTILNQRKSEALSFLFNAINYSNYISKLSNSESTPIDLTIEDENSRHFNFVMNSLILWGKISDYFSGASPEQIDQNTKDFIANIDVVNNYSAKKSNNYKEITNKDENDMMSAFTNMFYKSLDRACNFAKGGLITTIMQDGPAKSIENAKDAGHSIYNGASNLSENCNIQ